MGSEQALIALEKSADEPILLLEDAARIINLEYDKDRGCFIQQNSARYVREVHNFRSQWILKWLLKKVSDLEPGGAKKKSQQNTDRSDTSRGSQLIRDNKAWALLLALMRSISCSALHEILLERQFTQFLCHAGSILNTDFDSLSPQLPDRILVDNSLPHEEYPQKRRKLAVSASPPAVEQRNHIYSRQLQKPLSTYLEVLGEYAQLVTEVSTAVSNKSVFLTRPIPVAWARDLDNASSLVSNVLQATIAIYRDHVEAFDHFATATDWLHLWHDYAVSSTPDTEITNKQFCEFSLNLCLELLESLPSKSTNKLEKGLRKAIERQIALHVILPLRSKFHDHCAAQWKAVRDHIAWSNVQPLYDQIILSFGKAIRSDTVLGVEYLSLKNQAFAPLLFSIAACLTSRDDLRRRQWEVPFLNCLFTCLLHLSFPQHLYRLISHDDHDLVPENTDLPFDSSLADPLPETLLAALRHEEVELALPTALYVFSIVLRWRGRSLPESTLGQLMAINSAAFVPQARDPNYSICLDLLLEHVDQRSNLSADEHAALLEAVIVPVMRAFARSRDIDGFVQLWIPRLEDAFRSRYGNQRSILDPALLYDDESLLAEFEEIIGLSALPGYGRDLLQSVARDISALTTRIGPTIDIFAKLTVICRVLRVRGKDLIASTPEVDVPTLMMNTVGALKQKSDYQGQRWRLWVLLKLLLSHSDTSAMLENLEGLIGDHISRLEAFSPADNIQRPSSLFMEFLQVFSIVVEHKSLLPANNNAFILHLLHLLRHLISQMEVLNSSTANMSCLKAHWNGKQNTLNTVTELVCGYAACLVQQPPQDVRLSMTGLEDEFQQLAYQALKLQNDDDFEQGSLGALIQNLYASVSEMEGSSVFSRYADVMLRDEDERIPPLMHRLSLVGLDKKQAKVYAEHLADKLLLLTDGKEIAPAKEIASRLALLAKIVAGYPVSIGLPEHFSKLLKIAIVLDQTDFVAQRPSKFMAERSLSVIITCLTRIFRTMWMRIQCLERSEKRSQMVKMVNEWCRSAIEGLDPMSASLSEVVMLDIVVAYIKEKQADLLSSGDQYSFEKHYLQKIAIIAALPTHKGLLSHLLQGNGCLAQAIMTSVGIENTATNLETLRQQALHETPMFDGYSKGLKNSSEDHGASLRMTIGALQDLIQMTSNESRFLTRSSRVSHAFQHLSYVQDHGLELETATKIAIALFDPNSIDVNLDPQLTSGVAQLACLSAMRHTKSISGLIFELDLSQTVLADHPDFVGQSTIDSLLQSLARVTSSSPRLQVSISADGHEDGKYDAIAIYHRLASIIGILLSRYRRRLNGRSHLLTIVLQNMVKCLFYTPERQYLYQNPANMKQKQAFRSSLPDWLHGGEAGQLPPSCGERLSRILSSICNPTTASARSAQKVKKRSNGSSIELNDETQKAKKIAAQYMQYVLIEYARSTLDGVIMVETRDRLLPGLFSILDCLDRDIMKVMNTSMDASSRAIFKELYDDWIKFGKWDQT